MPSYKLVNPVIEGTVKTEVEASSHIEAAKKLWNNLSQHVAGDVPKFAFSVEGGGSTEHFKVIEKSNHGQVSFEIESLKVTKARTQKLHRQLARVQAGGANGNDNHDEDDSSDDEWIRRAKYKKLKDRASYPIVYWYYDPLVYGLKSLYVPTFTYGYKYTPYVEIVTNDIYLYV